MRIDISIGDKFGHWEVIAEAKPRVLNEYWLCKCVCGKEREVFRGSLLSNRTKSCGCKKKRRQPVNPKK